MLFLWTAKITWRSLFIPQIWDIMKYSALTIIYNYFCPFLFVPCLEFQYISQLFVPKLAHLEMHIHILYQP